MGLIPRNILIYDGCLFHVTWQCHNKEWHLKEDWTKRCYYDLLLRYQKKYSITFYGYHFMENHMHLVGKQENVKDFSDFFRTVHNLFARFVNRKYLRKGQMIMGRLKSIVIESDRHLLSVMAYVDLNGVRAKRDQLPEDSKWSSYNFYAYGKGNDLLTPAPTYLALSDDLKERQKEYRAIVRAAMLTHEILSNI